MLDDWSFGVGDDIIVSADEMIVVVEARCLVAVLAGCIEVGQTEILAITDVDGNGEREFELSVGNLTASRESFLRTCSETIDGCFILYVTLVGGERVEGIVEGGVEQAVEGGIDFCLAAGLQYVSANGYIVGLPLM